MYIIQEIQMTEGQDPALLPAVFKDDYNEMESVRFLKLSYAATSTVDIHAVLVYTEFGDCVHQNFFDHRPKPAPEPEEPGETNE